MRRTAISLSLLSLLLSPSVLMAQDSKSAIDASPQEARDSGISTGSKSKESSDGQPSNLETVEDAIAAGKGLWAAIKAGAWREVVATAVMLLMFLWRRINKFFISGFSKFQLMLTAVILSYLGMMVTHLTADTWSWGSFIWNGLLASAEAIALWKTIGQRVLPKVFGQIPIIAPAT